MGSRRNKPNRKLTVHNAPTQHPTILDIVWAAGVWEGEGSVSGRSHNRTSLTVHVTQKDDWILLRLRELFGGSVGDVKMYEKAKFKSSGCCRWAVTGPRARGFVLSIFSLLSPRRKQQIKEAMKGFEIADV